MQPLIARLVFHSFGLDFILVGLSQVPYTSCCQPRAYALLILQDLSGYTFALHFSYCESKGSGLMEEGGCRWEGLGHSGCLRSNHTSRAYVCSGQKSQGCLPEL